MLSSHVYTTTHLYVFIELHWVSHTPVVESKVEVDARPRIIHLGHPGNKYNHSNLTGINHLKKLLYKIQHVSTTGHTISSAYNLHMYQSYKTLNVC